MNFHLSCWPTQHEVTVKTVWIIDGAYMFNHGRSHPFDYLKLKEELIRLNEGSIDEAYYLNSTRDPSTEAQNSFYSWLKSAPPRGPKIRVQLYRLKDLHIVCPKCGAEFNREVQKGVDVGIATLIIKLATKGAFDRLILSAGDGDFEDAISYVKSDLNKEVWICGAHDTLSCDLQSYSDRVIWLEDLHPTIDKPA